MSPTGRNSHTVPISILAALAAICSADALWAQEKSAPPTPEAAPAPSAQPAPAPRPPRYRSRSAESKPEDAKPAEPKPEEAKPSEPKPAESKPVESKPVEPKTAEPKSAESKPAESKPPESKPDTPPPVPSAPPASPSPEKAPRPGPSKPEAASSEPEEPGTARRSFTPLADPEVAERLGFTPEQKSRVAALMAERTAKLATATPAQRASVLRGSDARLASVLTSAQRAEWAKLHIEPKLRFNFRFQKWIDVLEWFAEQADLSLVLDAPPPGTFSYTDTRDYTATEALDLINGVLLTKGYTLIRRNRMLLLINLADGVPKGVVPRIDVKELDTRGKYELVTVAFTVGRRSMDAVLAEIKPLLGPHGEAVPLPTSQQLLITEAAGVMRSIQAVITSIPEPLVPPVSPAAPAVMASYVMKPADPKVVQQVFTALAPTAKLVFDAQADRLHVFASEAEQTMFKKVLTDLQATLPPEKQARLEVYPVAESAGASLLATLKLALPDSRISLDAKGAAIVAWAAPDEQAMIKKTIERLAAERKPGQERQLEVYRLARTDPDATMKLLQALLPEARLTFDTQTRTIVALALPADQQVIKSTLQTLAPEKPGPEAAEIRYYSLPLGLPPEMLNVVKQSAPEAIMAMEATGDRLMAVATPAMHTRLKAVLDKVQKDVFLEGRNKLVIYPVTHPQRTRFMAVLNSIKAQLPGVQIITDAEPGELAVWAKQNQHEVLEKILEELKREVPPEQKPQLVAYPVESGNAASAQKILETLYPQAKIMPDPHGTRLLVWTRAAEQAAIKESLKQLDSGQPGNGGPRFEVYPTRGAGGPKLLLALQPLVPNARLTVDPNNGNLVAWGTADEHKQLQSALAKLVPGGALGAEGMKVEAYPLTKGDPQVTLSTLKELVPDAKLSLDLQGNQLIAVAGPAEQKMISDAMARLQPGEPNAERPQLQFLAVKQTPPESLLELLKTVAPRAKVTVDADNKRLAVLAAPAEFKTIQATLEEYEKAGTDGKQQMAVYTLKSADPASVVNMLSTMFPGAKVVSDKKTRRLMVLSRPEDQQALKKVIEEMDTGPAVDTHESLRVYPVGLGAGRGLVAMLEEMFPDMQFQTDYRGTSITVRGNRTDHEALAKIMDQLTSPEGQQRQMAVYPLGSHDPQSVQPILAQLAPRATITPDVKKQRIVVLASAQDQAVLREAVEKLTKGGKEADMRVVAYTVETATPYATVMMLKDAVPGATFSAGGAAGRILAWASDADHKLLQQIIQQIGSGKQSLVVYPMKSQLATALARLFEYQPLRGARVMADPHRDGLVVWADPQQQESIKQTVEEYLKASPQGAEPSVQVYRFRQASPVALQLALAKLTPGAQLSPDPYNHTLIVTATPEDHAKIAAVVKKLEEGGDGAAFKAVSYIIKSTSPYATAAVLRAAAPGAVFAPGAEPGQMVVWASEADHKVVQQIVEQMKGADDKNGPHMAIYNLRSGRAYGVVTVLQTMIPDAKCAIGSNPQQLIAFARPEEQAKIREIVEKMGAPEPPETAPRITVYTLRNVGAFGVVRALAAAMPQANFSLGADPSQLIASATPAEHALIKTAVDQIEAAGLSDNDRVLTVYDLKSKEAAALVEVLDPKLLKSARVVANPDRDGLIVWAQPAEQAAIKKAVEQFKKELPKTIEPTVKVYRFRNADPKAAQMALMKLTPNAQVALDMVNHALVASALPDDHQKIAAAVKQMDEGGEGDAMQVVAYPTKSATPLALIAVLKSAVPDAVVSSGNNPNQIVAWAREGDHKIIRQIVEKMGEPEPAETAPRITVHTLRNVGAAGVAKALEAAMPQAQFSLGADPTQLIVTARPADLALIKAAVEQIEAAGIADENRVLAVYDLKSREAAALVDVLDPKLLKSARVVASPDRDGLIVWAEPAEQAAIKKAVEQFKKELPKTIEPTVKVYRFRNADPKAAQMAFMKMAPNAQIALDMLNRALVVSALAEDHDKIATAVKQLDVEDENVTAKLEIHRVTSADVTELLAVLQGLFRRRLDVQLAADLQNGAIIVLAAQPDQAAIRSLIDQWEKGLAGQSGAKLHLYSLKGIDPTAALEVLNKVLDKHGAKPQLSIESYSNQLIAIAPAQQQALIQETLERLRSEERGLDILPLENVESATALTAVRNLFAGEGTGAPEAEFDAGTQQLFVRGTKQQFEKIRALLVRMGETGLATGSGGGTRIRVVPLSGDLKAAIQEIERVWPQLRANPIRMVPASAISPLLRQQGQTAVPEKDVVAPPIPQPPEKPGTSAVKPEGPPAKPEPPPAKPEPPPAKPEPAPAKPESAPAKPASKSAEKGAAAPSRLGHRSESVANGDEVSGSDRSSAMVAPLDFPSPFCHGLSAQPQPPTDDLPPPYHHSNIPTFLCAADAPGAGETASEPPAPPEPKQSPGKDTLPPAVAPGAKPGAKSEPGAPILIAISDGTVTIASDDTEALDLFESLLRSMSQRSGSVGRNIAVYSLKNTSAASVAATLQQLFRTGRGDGAGANGAMGAVGRRGRGPMGALGTLVIVPDERTNSILVQGSRAERNAIENFLKVLDSAELPPALAAQKPRTIAIQNTNAARIAELVRSIFRAQLTPGTGRGAGAAPSWLATDLTVDDVTNSLIVTGPKPLVDAIEQFAVSTDEAARDDKSREVVIISLKKASADRVQQVLDAMMKRASTPRAGSSRSSTSRSPQSPPAPAPSPSPPRRNSP